jgi:ferritin-like protein
MAQASGSLHEPRERLRPETIDMHRAIVSLMEELEAIDWYAQRVDAADDPALREVLAHNLDEEREHAAMTLEWIRRHDPLFDAHLRRFLFQEGAIVGEEEAAEEAASQARGGAAGAGEAPALGIGSLLDAAPADAPR